MKRDILGSFVMMLVLACILIPRPALAYTSAKDRTSMFDQENSYTSAPYTCYNGGSSMHDSACRLFSYAHAIEWLKGVKYGDQLLLELVEVCCSPSNEKGHDWYRCKESKYPHTKNNGGSFRAYGKLSEEKYKLKHSTSVSMKDETAAKKLFDEGWVVTCCVTWNGSYTNSKGNEVKDKGGHIILAVDYDIDPSTGDMYIHIIDSCAGASTRRSTRPFYNKTYSFDGKKITKNSASVFGCKEYWIPWSTFKSKARLDSKLSGGSWGGHNSPIETSPLDEGKNSYWKTAQTTINIYNSPFEKTAASTISKGDAIVIKEQGYDSTAKVYWFVTIDGKYVKQSEVGQLGSFTKYVSQGTGTEIATLTTTVRPINPAAGLYNEPYASSIKMRTVTSSDTLTVKAIIENSAHHYWLKVTYQSADYYLCANMVKEYVDGSPKDVWIDGSWTPRIDYPSGDYPENENAGIPLHGTIKSNYPIRCVVGGWYKQNSFLPLAPAVDAENKWFVRTEPSSGEFGGFKTKSVVIKDSNINTLSGRSLKQQGKGSYFYQLHVSYWGYKNVTSDSELPLQVKIWASDKYKFTVGGGSAEENHGDTVSAIPVTKVELNEPSIILKIEGSTFESCSLLATVTPENATDKKVEWSSSDTSIATVVNGKVTAVGTGTTTITATAADGSGKKDTCSITVVKPVIGVTVTSNFTGPLYINGTTTGKLTAILTPSDADNTAVTWSSSDSSIVSVDQSGNITAKAVGTATITARTANGRQGTCQVVVRAYVDTVTLSGRSSVNVGDTIKLTAAVLPANAINKNLNWTSSDTSIATVDASGSVNGIKKGNVTITATAADRGTKAGTFSVDVVQPVTGISISGASSLLKGNTITLSVTATPANANDKSITWSSENTSIAAVNNGAVTGIAAGNTTIWATAADGSGVKTPYSIHVLEPVTGITISGDTVVPVDGTVNLTAVVTPENADNRSLNWTVAPSNVASVNNQGVVTGLQPGTATITASATDGSGVRQEYTIQVVQQVIAVKIDGENLVYTGSTVQLKALVTSNETLTDTSVTWSSSDSSVVTVNASGLLTGIENGTAIITATSNAENYYSAQHRVTVDTLVSKITVSGTSKVDAGNTTQLSATVAPATATNKTFIWSSSNESVAIVSGNGLVTAVSEGTATITAAAADGSGVKGTLKITIYPLPSSVTISGESDLLVDATAQLTEIVLPDNARNKSVTWSSSDTTIATVNASGLVTAKGNGTAVITATATGNTTVTAQHEVTVNTLVSEVTLDAPERVDVGEMGTVSATILPATASNKQLVWTSSDEEVAVVDANGCVFGIAGGYVTITATTVDGSEIAAEAEIQIFQYAQSVSVDIEPVAYVGQKLYPYTIILPEDVSDPYVTWTSSNENVIRIDDFESESDYVLAAVCLQPGVAKITAIATDGSGVSGYAYVQVYPYTELTRNTATYNIYTTGETNSRIGRVSLTADSSSRAAEDKHGAVWHIEHVSGDYAAALGINERTYSYNGFTLANSVDLMLLGINSTGSDTYRVTCTINGQTDACLVTVNVEEPAAPLPESVSLSTTTYSAGVGEAIAMDITPVVSPATAALPDNANSFLYGVDSFNRYAQVTMGDDVFTVTFSKAGVYTAYVRYEGSNYQYDAYATFVITTPEGTVPPEIESLSIDNSVMYMLPGETAKFDVSIYPTGADETALLWSSSDPDVVTVAADGTMTAVATGTSIITVSAGNGISTTGFVAVTESLLSIDWNPNDIIEVFVGGESRTVIQKVYLTARASAQLTSAPTWTIKRQYGNNLTLTCEPITAANANGDLLYGCSIILKSVSNIGTTEYELTCSDGVNSASTTIQVNANRTEDALPSLVQWNNTTFTGTVNQRMTIYPVVQCWPTGTTLPDEVTISIEGDSYWNVALKASDYTVSRGMITFAFNAPGVYTANVVYSCSNMRYLVPIAVRVADSSGNVPVRLTRLTLNESSLSIEEGTTFQLLAITAPTDATDKTVRWSSDDPDVVTVNSDGLITAVSNGTATIWCTPNDSGCSAVKCSVVVEDAFTITEYTDMPRQYLQGKTGFSVTGYEMSPGTKTRISAEGASLTWSLSRVSGNAATVELQERDGVQFIVVTELHSGGTDVYEVTCTAGSHTWTGQATLEVIDLDTAAPESVTIAQKNYTVAVGEEVELDFTPVCLPSGTSIPSELYAQYIRTGNLLSSLVDSYRSSVRNATGDKVKVAFKVPGVYLMSRSYSSCNLTYIVECTITVGDGNLDLLRCDDTEPIVYVGGQSGIASTCYIRDVMVEELYGDEFVWTAERISGDCLTVALRANQNTASLYVANTKSEGIEVWRVSCTFRGITDSVDVTIHAVEAIEELPEATALYQSSFDGMIGNVIAVPLAVQCEPEGTSLPTTSHEDWRFVADGNTASYAEWSFADGQMSICFAESGYYGGRLIYESGNVTYSFPVSFAITDEESVQAVPEYINLFLSDDTVPVYPEGETEVSLVKAVLSDSINMHSVSSIAAYAEREGTTWSVEILSGSACTLSIQASSAATAQVILDSITGTGDVTCRVNCLLAGTTYSKQLTIHVAGDGEARPEPQVKNDYFTTATGTVLTIDASFYDRHSNLKLCSGADSIWENADALAAMGFEYEASGDLWRPTFYEEGVYTTTITNMIGNLRCSQDVIIVAYTDRPLPASPSMFTFPRALQEIDTEAFANVNIHVVDLRCTSVTTIQARAFADNDVLMRVYIPASVTSISTTAFEGCQHFVVYCIPGSYAESWAKQNRYPVIYMN